MEKLFLILKKLGIILVALVLLTSCEEIRKKWKIDLVYENGNKETINHSRVGENPRIYFEQNEGANCLKSSNGNFGNGKRSIIACGVRRFDIYLIDETIIKEE